MKEQPTRTISIEIGETDNVFAYCSDCEKPVFIGDDRTELKKRILRDRIVDHLTFFSQIHEITVVFPKKEKDNVIDGEQFVRRRPYNFDIPARGLRGN